MFRLIRILLACGLALSLGCQQRPHAPALLSDPIYQNDQAGFRFEVPNGWVVQAKSMFLPDAVIHKEKVLAGYKRTQDGKPAIFEISCLDAPEGYDLVDYFTNKRAGANAWKHVGKLEAIEAGGVPASRLTFEYGDGPKAERKEVTAVRRGGRLYFFTVEAEQNDRQTIEEVRRALETLTWKKQ